MSNKTYIYALVKEDTNELFYIGKTNDITKRKAVHNQKYKGINYDIVVLDEVEGTDTECWREPEAHWIKRAKMFNHQLDNKNNGGCGSNPRKRAKWEGKKIREGIIKAGNNTPIQQWTLDGKLVKEWEVMLDAKKLYSGVANVLRGISHTAGGYNGHIKTRNLDKYFIHKRN